MVPVAGRPFLEWLILHLKKMGVRDFVLLVGYKSEIILEHFKDGRAFGCNIQYAVEKDLLGTGGAILNAAPFLQNEFLVISGDNFLRLDYESYLEQFHNAKALGQLACWNNQPPIYRSNVHLDKKSNRILDYDFHESAGKNFVDIGFKIFNKELLTYFPKDRKVFSLEIDVLSLMAKQGLLMGFPVDHPNLDVGTVDGLEKVRQTLTGGSHG